MKHTILIVLIITAGNLFSQVKIITLEGEEHYGIVTNEDTESITILKKDGFMHVIQLKEITLLNETDSHIKTKDSLSYKVHIYFIDKDSVYYHIGKSRAPKSIPRANVIDIVYYSGDDDIKGKANETQNQFNENIAKNQVKDNKVLIDGSYWMYGLTLLCPGGINLLVGKQSENGYGWRLQAGCSPDLEDYIIIGAQWNFMYNLKKERNFEHNLSVGLGITTFETIPYHNQEELFYSGFFYDVNVGGFFLETGIAFVEANISKSFMFIQFGYVFR